MTDTVQVNLCAGAPAQLALTLTALGATVLVSVAGTTAVLSSSLFRPVVPELTAIEDLVHSFNAPTLLDQLVASEGDLQYDDSIFHPIRTAQTVCTRSGACPSKFTAGAPGAWGVSAVIDGVGFVIPSTKLTFERNTDDEGDDVYTAAFAYDGCPAQTMDVDYEVLAKALMNAGPINMHPQPALEGLLKLTGVNSAIAADVEKPVKGLGARKVLGTFANADGKYFQVTRHIVETMEANRVLQGFLLNPMRKRDPLSGRANPTSDWSGWAIDFLRELKIDTSPTDGPAQITACAKLPAKVYTIHEEPTEAGNDSLHKGLKFASQGGEVLLSAAALLSQSVLTDSYDTFKTKLDSEIGDFDKGQVSGDATSTSSPEFYTVQHS